MNRNLSKVLEALMFAMALAEIESSCGKLLVMLVPPASLFLSLHPNARGTAIVVAEIIYCGFYGLLEIAGSCLVFSLKRLVSARSTATSSKTTITNTEKVARRCSFCKIDPSVISCGGTSPASDSYTIDAASDHHFCRECFNSYFNNNGASLDGGTRVLESLQINRNGLVSRVGDVPCPFFPDGYCSCHSLPLDEVERHLSDDSMVHYIQAIIRLRKDPDTNAGAGLTEPVSGPPICATCEVDPSVATYEDDATPLRKDPDTTSARLAEPLSSLPPICTICGVDPSVITCADDTTPHALCSECFNSFARTAFEEGGGTFTREVLKNDNVSAIGELPCPFFLGGDCSCTAIPRSTFLRHLSEETMDLWEQARDRIAVTKADQERRDTEQALEVAAQQSQQPVEFLIRAVQEALTVGSNLGCPNCSVKGEKDDGCMHIRCSECNCSWCYCCGRPRGAGPDQCSSCDAHGVCLQSKRGWGNLERTGESKGYGALHEYHRQRQRFFLRQIKESVSGDLWSELRTTTPELLNDTPTTGRHIEWENIDEASPPLFGRTQESDLLWRNDAEPIISHLQEQLNRQQPPPPSSDQNHQQNDADNRERRALQTFRRRMRLSRLFRRRNRLYRAVEEVPVVEAQTPRQEEIQPARNEAPRAARDDEYDGRVIQDLVDDILQFGGPGDTDLLRQLLGNERYQEVTAART